MRVLDYNNDGSVDMNDIYDIIKDLMATQEKTNNSGDQKLENVLLSLKLMLSPAVFQKYEELIIPAIEFIHRIFFLKKRCCFGSVKK